MAFVQGGVHIAKPQISINLMLPAAVDNNLPASIAHIPRHLALIFGQACHDLAKIGGPALA